MFLHLGPPRGAQHPPDSVKRVPFIVCIACGMILEAGMMLSSKEAREPVLDVAVEGWAETIARLTDLARGSGIVSASQID